MLRRSTSRPAATRTTSRRAGATFEQLEGRQMLAVSPVVAGTKIKGVNVSSGNLSTNQTRITVPFTGNINIADVSKIQLRGYALNPLSANLAQIKKVVNVVSAQVLTTDFNNDGVQERQYLEIITDRLMRKGGSIIFYEGCLTDDNGDTLAEQTRKTVKGQNKERFTLANRGFIPTNFNRFTNDIFDQSADAVPGSTDIPEATITANLDAFLQKKVTAGTISQAQKDAAMATYNSDTTKARIGPANLRAALVSLTGTLAEGAIASYLSDKYIVITFQDPTDPNVPVAQTSARPQDGRLRTVFHTKYDGEPFQVLSSWLAHEALHQDNSFGLHEEVAATTFGVLVNAQQAQTDNGYLKAGTELVNKENEYLLALLNSGRTIFPYVGVKDASMRLNANLGVFPHQKAAADGGGVYTSFEDYVRRIYIARSSPNVNTTGNALLNDYYFKVTGKAAPANMQFSEQIMTDIDTLQFPLGTRAAIVLAQQLKLKLS